MDRLVWRNERRVRVRRQRLAAPCFEALQALLPFPPMRARASSSVGQPPSPPLPTASPGPAAPAANEQRLSGSAPRARQRRRIPPGTLIRPSRTILIPRNQGSSVPGHAQAANLPFSCAGKRPANQTGQAHGAANFLRNELGAGCAVLVVVFVRGFARSV
ncbi:hypothetical protein TARUN_376 [Trichoderma arundinaceum]|uniref:Uncharacterized protein n=1 Tax=Trichoderma arundinaceum TaxID=490622 RepID=A0A395P0B1_TRIAR|nr:hypothetical protein TARUN_376 [Trichoderma arundinaceum]